MKQKSTEIQGKLDTAKAPINRESLWDNIHQHDAFPSAPKKSSKKRYLLLLLLLVGLGFGLAGLWYFDQSGGKIQVSPEESKVKLSGSKAIADKEVESCPQVALEETKEKVDNSFVQGEVQTKAEQVEIKIAAQNEVPARIKKSTLPKIQERDERQQKISTLLDKVESLESTSIQAVANNHSVSVEQFALTELEKLKFALELNRPIVKKASSLPPPNEKEFSKGWTLGFNTGAGYAFHKLALIDSLGDRVNVPLREEHTRTQISYLAEIALTRYIENGWQFGFNLQYALDRQQFSLVHQERVSYSPSPNNSGSFFDRQIDQTTYNYYHRYQSLYLGFAVGRRTQGERLQLAYSLGLGTRLFHWSQGRLLTEDIREYDLRNENDYKSQVRSYAFGQVDLIYPLNPKLALKAGVEVKSPLRLTRSDVPLLHEIIPVYGKLGVHFAL